MFGLMWVRDCQQEEADLIVDAAIGWFMIRILWLWILVQLFWWLTGCGSFGRAVPGSAVSSSSLKGAKRKVPTPGSADDLIIKYVNAKAEAINRAVASSSGGAKKDLTVPSVVDQLQALANQCAAQATFYMNQSNTYTSYDYYLRVIVGVGTSANLASILGAFGPDKANKYSLIISMIVVVASVLEQVGQYYVLSTADWNFSVGFSSIQSEINLQLATATQQTDLGAFYKQEYAKFQALMTDNSTSTATPASNGASA